MRERSGRWRTENGKWRIVNSPFSVFHFPLAVFGLALFVFATVALSGPGRIDIVDGQTRYEVARSLVEHGDSIIRDPHVDFNVFPGRDGARYTYYRFPQSVLGVAAIWLADLTGPTTEARRHFFFVLTSAAACALLAIVYAGWFRALGHAEMAAIFWAVAGIFCTPNWFYGTSTFDDILGATAVVAALATAYHTRDTSPRAGALWAGLLLGLAYNCKQPLGAFVIAAAALHDRGGDPWPARRRRILLVFVGLAMGVAVENAYDWWKFPPGTKAAHAETLRLYAPIWSNHILRDIATAVVCLAVSPATGVFWYCPPLLLSCYGLPAWLRRERIATWGVVASLAIFVLFVASMLFFKGDPSWGPRYLTPVFSVLWLFAPAGAALLRRRLVAFVLVMGLLVQLLALAVDPHRLYIEHNLPSAFGVVDPWSYFRPAYSHLPNRPREIVEIVNSRDSATAFTPARAPTAAVPVIDALYRANNGPEIVQNYHILNSLRPWWLAQRYLPANERPVDLTRYAGLLAALAAFGAILIGLSHQSLTSDRR